MKKVDIDEDELYALDLETAVSGWRIVKCGKVIAKEESSGDEDDDFLFVERDIENCREVNLEELTEYYRSLGGDCENFGNNQSAISFDWDKCFNGNWMYDPYDPNDLYEMMEHMGEEDEDGEATNVCKKCKERYEYAGEGLAGSV